MASIDDIWDTPVTPSSPRTPRHLDTDNDDVEVQRPSKRQKQALFLSDSEDEGGGGGVMRRGVVKAPPPVIDSGMDVDVEAMFADAENDEALSFKKIDDLDVAAMEREAEERHRRSLPLTPHPVMPSSSPVRDDGTTGNGAGGSKNDKGKSKDTKKRARPVPLNENLLLGPTGFPELISQVKDFKLKGKGREAEDLTRLMRIYNFWAHKLHPKLKFHDTVVRIEKLCHTKRMQVALSVWRDEAHGKTHELDGDLSLDSDEDDTGQINNAAAENGGSRATLKAPSEISPSHSIPSGPDTDHDHLSLPPSSRASSQPPTSDFPDEDDFFDPSTSHSRPNVTSASTTAAAKRKVIVDDDDDEEGFWKDLESAKAIQPAQQHQSSKPQPTSAQSMDDLDDAEMWAALEDVTNPSSMTSGKPPSGNTRAASNQVDGTDIDDDDMWDIIRENEKSVPTQQPTVTDPTITITESASKATKYSSTGEKSVAESEMDWDDMYAD